MQKYLPKRHHQQPRRLVREHTTLQTSLHVYKPLISSRTSGRKGEGNILLFLLTFYSFTGLSS